MKTATPFSDRFSRFLSSIARIKNWACRKRTNGNSDHPFDELQQLRDSELIIIECVHGDSYKDEMKNLKESSIIPHNGTINSLSCRRQPWNSSIIRKIGQDRLLCDYHEKAQLHGSTERRPCFALNHWPFPFESMSSGTPYHGGGCAFSRLWLV